LFFENGFFETKLDVASFSCFGVRKEMPDFEMLAIHSLFMHKSAIFQNCILHLEIQKKNESTKLWRQARNPHF
jgi:hypothetical protein